MIKLIRGGAYYMEGRIFKENSAFLVESKKQAAIKGTIAYGILNAHNKGAAENLKIKFDSLVSHDITYVGIIQTARASGMTEFPVPYTLTNCHNSLCAVGGTINEDDHVFGLSAAKKYGGNFVAPNLAVIHQYMREAEAKCGGMILGSDSHTRYGAFGTMAIGEGGGELVKQLLKQTYDIPRPDIVVVYLKGKPAKGVGPHDVALALIAATFKKGFLKNKVLEFVGPGIKNLSMDYRSGIDVMTTETGCLSSIWETDEITKDFFVRHGREKDFKELHPTDPAYYDGAVIVDLSRIEPMIAMPFHPSNAFTIKEFLQNADDILGETEKAGNALVGGGFKLRDKIKDGKVFANQGIIAGCAGGTYENIAEVAEMLKNYSGGGAEYSLNIYPQSQPVFKSLSENGYISSLIGAGAIIKPCFCGPCFGAGDTPANNGLSVRHVTRNFENREGSKPNEGQLAAVALMDARSVAATYMNGGYITPATEVEYTKKIKKYFFDKSIYKNRVYYGVGHAEKNVELVFGKNIADWPEQIALKDKILLKAVSVLNDEVTTTDELIPSGETSSYRSNPLRLAEYTLSRKDPEYVGRAKAVKSDEEFRRVHGNLPESVLSEIPFDVSDVLYGSCIVAKKPGDGSAREQAVSCQRVLGGLANIAVEYATKRYRSNLINWGILPFTCKKIDFEVGDYIYIDNLFESIKEDGSVIAAKHISGKKVKNIYLEMGALTAEEKKILLSGCLINYNKNL